MVAAAGVWTAIGLALLVTGADVGAPFQPVGSCSSASAGRLARFRCTPLVAFGRRSTRNLRATVASATWWGIALACYAMALTALLRQVQQNLENLVRNLAAGNPMIAEVVARVSRGGNVSANLMFLNFVFTLLVVVVAAFAVSTASGWAYEEEEGRLGLVLAAPCARHRVIPRTLCHLRSGAGDGDRVHLCRLRHRRIGRRPAARHGTRRPGRLRHGAGWPGRLVCWLSPLGLAPHSDRDGDAHRLRPCPRSVVALLARLLHWPDGILQLSIFRAVPGSPLIDGLRPSACWRCWPWRARPSPWRPRASPTKTS